MKYWERPETKEKLTEAYKELKYPITKKPNRKKGKLWLALARRSPNTSFEAMYKVCFEFKKKFHNKTPEEKLRKLIKLSNQHFKNSRPYEERREKKHGVSVGKKCWVCKDKANIQHHIILIKNGGYDNGINRVCICNKCHEKIHEWMPAQRKERETQEEYNSFIEQEYT